MATTITARELRHHWINGLEIALIDVREEGPFSEAHPLFAISIPVSEIEEKITKLVPRKTAPLVVYDNGEGFAERAIRRLSSLGYEDVRTLQGGLTEYSKHGEVYRDVNSYCKAFGELVESIRKTPSLPADEIKKLIDANQDLVVLDARRYEEFNTMSIPRGRSCPGGELVYRIGDVVQSPSTTVIVNCAGRTRSIIGTQSLINSGIPNKVVALRNGTIGWTLAGLDVDRGRTERIPEPGDQSKEMSRYNAAKWTDHVGVPVIGGDELAQFRQQSDTRTLYLLDVRDPAEYALNHPPGFLSAPGGQLVQATDEWIGVRGGRIVLHDDDGVRARMTASWLYQMGWDVSVLREHAVIGTDSSADASEDSRKPSDQDSVTVDNLRDLGDSTVIDLARSTVYSKGHVPGAYFASGPNLARDIQKVPGKGPLVLTSPDGKVAAANLKDAQSTTSRKVVYLLGGTSAWAEAGEHMETDCRRLSEPIDVYKRPYEGTDNARANMQAYIDWELQLVAQLANDGVSRFRVVRPKSE